MASRARNGWHRRGVLDGLSRLALAPLGFALLPQPSWAYPDHPDFAVPDGACDCHHHFYDRRFPYSPAAVLKPPPATVADYRRFQQHLETTRDVAVTPSTYGFNNDCLLDALAQGRGARRGIAVVPPSVSDATLKILNDAGVRGVRIQFGAGNPLGADAILPLALRIQPLGWQMQFNMPAKRYVELESVILQVPVTIVIDHLAQIPGSEGVKSPAYRTVRRILDTGRGWVKLSSADAESKIGPPDYPDTSAIAKGFIAAAPERVIWGSNWPFPGMHSPPDAVHMLDLLAKWAPDPALRHRILVENPEKLFGFDPADRPKVKRT